MTNCKPAATPAVKESRENISQESNSINTEFPFRQAVGALSYLMVATRPDIAFSISVVSRKIENPSTEDVIKVKRIMRYLKGTESRGLIYKRSVSTGLESYSDADHGGDLDTGHSTSGILCLLHWSLVSWESKKQKSVALSSTEAELVADSEACREMVWLKRLVGQLTSPHHTPTLYVDNEGAVKLAHNPPYEYHRRTKHIRLRYYYVRECVNDGVLKVEQVPAEEQLADMLTKPLFKPRLAFLSQKIGLSP
ncbi:uncharacterized protein [Choristoneura fumiferana]|uniref:uncharacterized protein n=1 Tax=Choristoneura fumiferana TaxID=7141 RepID=UPI003D159888